MQGEQIIPDQSMCSDERTALADGRGLSLDQIRERLAAQHQTIVSVDDPILMLVTVLNAFLAEEEQLLNRHNKALTTILSVRTDGYVKAVEQATANLGEKLSSASLESISKILSTQRQKMDQFRSHMTWLAIVAGTSALINVAAFAALALR